MSAGSETRIQDNTTITTRRQACVESSEASYSIRAVMSFPNQPGGDYKMSSMMVHCFYDV